MSLIRPAVENEAVAAAADDAPAPQLSNAELAALRKMLSEFAIIRGTCPMAIRALSTRK